MAKTISFGLSVAEVMAAADEVRKYKEELNRKVETLCKRLCDEGIQIAQGYIGGTFGGMVQLQSEITPEQAGCRAVYYMSDTQTVTQRWLNADGERSADISPSLMIEFGTGLLADNPAGVPGVGTGTFPGGIHGADPNGWWFMDLSGTWHHSVGYAPRMPMYKSGQELSEKVTEIASEVFG